MNSKSSRRLKIKKHVRKHVSGTVKCPRLTVFRSNRQIYSQLIDDVNMVTLTEASSLKFKKNGTKKEISVKIGELISQKAKAIGIEKVIFDRNGYLYHGRIKELADAARKGGLKF